MPKIKAIVKRPDENVGHMTWISDTLENLQKHVEGPIEVVRLSDNSVIICNEEGKLRGLSHNFYIGTVMFADAIVGTAVIVGTDGEEFADVPFDMSMWKRLLTMWGNTMY